MDLCALAATEAFLMKLVNMQKQAAYETQQDEKCLDS